MSKKVIRLLLVEDNDTDALVAREELLDAVDVVFEMSRVDRLRSAVSILEIETFDVVVLDLTLPDSDGLDTFLKFRAAAPNLPVVVASHHSAETIALQALQAGAQDYLVKGLSHGLLVRTIRYAIERAQIQLALHTTEERLSGVIKAAMDAIISIDSEHQIVVFNAAAELMFGYSAKDIIGQALNKLIPQALRAQHEEHIDNFSATGTSARTMGNLLQLNAVRANGEEFPMEASISKINVSGQVMFTAIVRDLTASTTARIALEASNKSLKRSMDALEHVVHYDALTGLPNRVLLTNNLVNAMTRCLYNGRSLGVAFIDLDAFKPINDTYGHDIGNELLVAVSQSMKSVLRTNDCLARIGGDEFVAILVDLKDVHDCEPLLKKLLTAVATTKAEADSTIQVTASIGVTIFPQDGDDADRLVRHADQAMYLAKQAGRNRYQLFDTEQASALSAKRENLSEIRRAIEQNEFVLYYQPKVNMLTGEVIGAEALIRWEHPERGFLQPAEFLPTIEDHIISIDIGNWVISAVLSQMSDWHTIGFDLPISINIGGLQLQSDDFVQHLKASLGEHPAITPHNLEVEILESNALQDISKVSGVIGECQSLGVHFAIDDFGTGYSSLTHLRRLPVELLKIDQSFIRDMLIDSEDLAIVKGVIGLAKAFGRKVIAEGVETVAHGSALLDLGCNLAQGYGIARPMPAKRLPEWVVNWQPDSAWSCVNNVSGKKNER